MKKDVIESLLIENVADVRSTLDDFMVGKYQIEMRVGIVYIKLKKPKFWQFSLKTRIKWCKQYIESAKPFGMIVKYEKL